MIIIMEFFGKLHVVAYKQSYLQIKKIIKYYQSLEEDKKFLKELIN